MRKVYLFQVTQHNLKRYVGKADPRDLVRLATKVEMKVEQEAQRPVNPKRLEEIATFVSGNGSLSTSIVIGTTNDNLTVHPVKESPVKNLYYMEFPETDAEFAKFKDSFDIMDGQHRLFSFLPEYKRLADDDVFELTFEMYIKPTTRDKRIIFKNTNEKQEKVASNLLMWFREKLGLLSGKERVYHPVVALLNTETCSPLKGRIIMGAEKITGGFKAQQVITILDKSDVINIAGIPLEDDKMLQMISEYLTGWEDAVGAKIAERDKELGAFSKIAGLRFMILLLPAFYDQAVNEKRKFSRQFISKKLNMLFKKEGMEPRDIFAKDSAYIKALGNNPFAGETPTTLLAKEWIAKLKNSASTDFDPLA